MELKLNEEMLQNKDMDAAYVEAPHDIKGFFGGIVEGVLQERDGGKASMWKCPGCGRVFKKKGQGHYCGEKPKTVDEYILSQDADKQEDLRYIRQVLQRALPEAEERISWSMPTYWKEHNILHFAASKKHIGLYPGPEAVIHFAEELQGYKKIGRAHV